MRLWDIEQGACLQILTGHSDEVNKMASSSQGDLLVSGSDDKTVRLWDMTSYQCLAVFQGFRSKVVCIEWVETSDTKYVVTGSGDGTIEMWEVVVDGGQYQLRLHWMTAKGELIVEDAIIQKAHGLSPLNRQLLQQRRG
jgi:WD40 repeat protein